MRSMAPMKFIRQGEDILLRLEANDSVRVIEMGEGAHTTPEASSLLGYSTGSWDEETLVVETTGIEADSLDNRGTDHSSAIRLLERFTPNAGGTRLDYSLRISDPNTFYEPFTVNRQWIWRPEIAVGRFACGEDQI